MARVNLRSMNTTLTKMVIGFNFFVCGVCLAVGVILLLDDKPVWVAHINLLGSVINLFFGINGIKDLRGER